jgi:hypothetical protein
MRLRKIFPCLPFVWCATLLADPAAKDNRLEAFATARPGSAADASGQAPGGNRQHAERLADAGVDFVWIGWSNDIGYVYDPKNKRSDFDLTRKACSRDAQIMRVPEMGHRGFRAGTQVVISQRREYVRRL